MHPVSQPDQRGVKAARGSPELTPREAEVLFWISQGKSNHDIGIILGAKTSTVCKHVEHILSKLNVENRTCAAVMALETYHSVAETPESKRGQPWAAIAGVIAPRRWPKPSRLSTRSPAMPMSLSPKTTGKPNRSSAG